ncbi:MAG: HlyC/CorC family transporter [Bdellovibrio sp.]|nr:HlyC/CorC family transporter [Bdellovibrio sp.]
MEPPNPTLTITILYILLSLFLVALNGFFVAAEFAIVKVRRTRLKELEGQGVAAARVSILMVDELDEYLSATQLGITLVSLALGWVGEESFYNFFAILFSEQVKNNPAQFHGVALGISFFIITLLHVVLGELVPKSMAIQRAEQVTLAISRPLRLFYWVFKPLIVGFSMLANYILKVFGFHKAEEDALSEEELKMVLQDSHDEGVISQSEAEIIHQAFEFSDKKASDIMIPEHQVQCLSLDLTIDENIEIAQNRMYTRFPLVRGGFQNILGIVHMKDALMKFPKSQSNEVFEQTARPVLFIDPNMREDKIMRLLNEKRTHLVVVRDPKTLENLGIVTLEDILEQLVGEIVDEHGN